MNLFIIYIGGKTSGSLIELHDMRFVIANKIEDTYEELRQSWWGDPQSLHLDCWGILKSTDTHNIVLKDQPSSSSEKLYFVNLGGYDPGLFTELHKNVFVVAENAAEAKIKAKKQIADWASPHQDYSYDIENIFCISQAMADKNNHYIHLEPTSQPKPFDFIAKYVPIG